jgi:hypothetical protein
MAETLYGLVLIVLIIFLPAGLYGGLRDAVAPRAAGRAGRQYGERAAEGSVN